MIVSTTKMTAAQFQRLGEDPPGVRLELVDGEVAATPSPAPRHAHALFTLARIIADHVDDHDLGRVLLDVDTILGPTDVRRPDILFVAKARLHIITDKGVVAAPDLCVEVISPSSVGIDRDDKFKQYAEAGVAHYWLVDPDRRTFDAFSLTPGSGQYEPTAAAKSDETISAPPFAALPIPLAKLWM